MKRALSRWWRRRNTGIIGKRDGAAAVEFALAFPIVIGLTMAIIDLAYISFAQISLEGAVREASRRGVTGYTGENDSREDYVRSTVVKTMDRFSLNSPVDIEMRVYDSFSNVGESEPFEDANDNGIYENGECFTDINQNGDWDEDMGRAGLGGPGDVVLYNAQVELRSLTPVFQWLANAVDEQIRLSAATVVRNEPYSLIASGAGGGTVICS